MSSEKPLMISDAPCNRWSISSNSGREQFDIAIGSRIDARTCLCAVALRRSFWARGGTLASANMTVDYEISLAQVPVEIAAMEDLLVDLGRWRDDATHFERQVTPESAGQKLVLSVCHDPGLIYSADKPAFKICYSNGASMSAKWMFVVDQSCIWLAMESIKGVLEGLSDTEK